MNSGYREIDHTADWELEVWAPNFTSLLENAAQGMYKLCGITLKGAPRATRSLLLAGKEREIIIVGFLSELLFLAEQENLGFDLMDFEFVGESLAVQLSGSLIETQVREIKAVTFHNLIVSETRDGMNTRIVFDV